MTTWRRRHIADDESAGVCTLFHSVTVGIKFANMKS